MDNDDNMMDFDDFEAEPMDDDITQMSGKCFFFLIFR